MDIRNIQKTGGQSYTVTLPKEWILENFAHEKARVKIYSKKHALTILPFLYKKMSGSPVCNIDFMTRKQIYRELIGYYLSGADEIVVKATKITFEQRAAVRDLTHRLIGCECMEGVGNRIILKNSLSHSYRDIPEFVDKMMSILLGMFTDTVKYLEDKDRQLARDIMERDVEIDRLNLGIMRSTLMRLRETETDETQKFSVLEAAYYKSIAPRLERVGDHIVRIADYYLMIDRKTPNSLGVQVRKSVVQTLHHLHLCQDIIFSLSKKKAHEYLDLYLKVNARNVKKKYPNTGIMDIVTSESISRINSYIANIAEETINYLNIKSVAG